MASAELRRSTGDVEDVPLRRHDRERAPHVSLTDDGGAPGERADVGQCRYALTDGREARRIDHARLPVRADGHEPHDPLAVRHGQRPEHRGMKEREGEDREAEPSSQHRHGHGGEEGLFASSRSA